ncbi:unnamed protein product, partial [Dibothriocephalus latus]
MQKGALVWVLFSIPIPCTNTGDATANEGTNQDGNPSNTLSRSTSVRGSRLFEPAFENLREPGPVAASVLSRTRQQPRSFMSPR